MLSEPEPLVVDIPAGQAGAPHRIICHQWGNPDAARTVICVHGLTRNGRDFDILARALAADCRVLCPDMPGRGQSQRLNDPAGYSYPAYVADMLSLVSQLNIARASWIGTSMGGIIGMMVAGARPGLIDALVLNDIGCVVPAAGLQRILTYAGQNPAFPTREDAENALRQRCATFGINNEAHWQQLFAHSFEHTPQGWRFACDPAILAAIPTQDIKDVDLWPLWQPVTLIPTLVIRGAQSDVLMREVAVAMQSRHPRLTLHEVESAGHAPALMADADVALIRQWLRHY